MPGKKIDAVDNANKYLKLLCLLFTLITILSGVLLFYISAKVSNEIKPFTAKIVQAQDKLNYHIEDCKRFDAVGRTEFGLIIKSMEKDIKSTKEYQVNLSVDQSKLAQEMSEMSQNVHNSINDIMKYLIENKVKN